MNLIHIDFAEPKFAPQHLDLFASALWQKMRDSSPSDKFLFDLSKLEWVSHEELVYLSGIFKELFNAKRNFFIKFRNDQPNLRQAKQIVSLWEYWKIQAFVPPNSIGAFEYDKYMDIDIVYINHLKTVINELEEKSTINNFRYFITPFTSFRFNPAMDQEQKIAEDIKRIYELDEKTNKKLVQYQSQTPFLNKTLSHIITKELYENAYDHAYKGEDPGVRECYFGLTLRNKLHDNLDNLQTILKQNFQQEEIPEAASFFTENGKFRNESLLQFTFLDFGVGIPATLKDAYDELTESQKRELFSERHFDQTEDTRILEYAFKSSSSRHAISTKFDNREQIPRGLYDVIEIVRRYKGLIVARSYEGKLLFDLSSGNMTDAIRYFSKKEQIFPGTMISIYIPESKQGIKKNSIKTASIHTIKTESPAYFSFLALQKSIYKQLKLLPDRNERKIALYEKTFKAIDSFFDELPDKKCTVYFDFAGCELDERPLRKILYYLASTYKINEMVNAVIVNPPNRDLVASVRDVILSMHKDVNDFLFHPLPCIYFDDDKQIREIIWIGISNLHDEGLLSQTLHYEVDSKRRTDFEFPDAIEGNIFSFDPKGNMIRNSPTIAEMALMSVILQCTLKSPDEVFLTAGNYYQYEFISFLEYLQDEKNCNFFVNHLMAAIPEKILLEADIILAITLSSQLLAKALKVEINDKLKKRTTPVELVRVSNYHSFYREKPFAAIPPGSKVLLIADVIGTGSLLLSVKQFLRQKGSQLTYVASLADTRSFSVKAESTADSEIPSVSDDSLLPAKVESLLKRPLPKYRNNFRQAAVISRINPITNGPNTLSIKKSEFEKIIIQDSKKFLQDLEKYDPNFLRIGIFEQNEVQHPYWLDVVSLFGCEKGRLLLTEIINKIKKTEAYGDSLRDALNSRQSLAFIKEELEKVQLSDSNHAKNRSIYSKLHNSLDDLKDKIQQLSMRVQDNPIAFLFYPIYSGVEEITNIQYKHEIFDDFGIEIIPIARINTPQGWRFTFPPKFLNEKTKEKTVFLLDAGSISGETIQQMIDTICYLDVRKIIVLSVIGRIDDFQREFLSRITEMTVKKLSAPDIIYPEKEMMEASGQTVPVHVYFGAHFHIPGYKLSLLNPFWTERAKLLEYQELNNLPSPVVAYLLKRLDELTPRGIDASPAYPDYLPRYNPDNLQEDDFGEVPAALLFHYRDQLGKISGYRFFNEYFDFFDDIIKTADLENSRGKKNQELELLMGVILHEPDLLRVVRELIPDLHAALRFYIDSIIFAHGSDLSDRCYYIWERYSLAKFYVLIAKQDLFYEKINIRYLIRLIQFCDDDPSFKSLNYFAFALFDELTHFKKDVSFETKNEMIENRIVLVRKPESIHQLSARAVRIIDKLQSYCNTNPFTFPEQNFQYHCNELRKIYNEEEVNGRTHETMENDIRIIYTQIDAIENQLKGELGESDAFISAKLKIIQNTWPKVKESLELIVMHTKALQGVLSLYSRGMIYNWIIGNRYSVESNIAVFDEGINDGSIITVVDKYLKLCKFFRDKIISDLSVCNKFFKFYKCDVRESFDMYAYYRIEKDGNRIENSTNFSGTVLVDIHERVLEAGFYDAIISNIKSHAVSNSVVTVDWCKTEATIELTVTCESKDISHTEVSDAEYLHKKSGLSTMKEIGSYYGVDVSHTDFESPHSHFQTKIIFPLSK